MSDNATLVERLREREDYHRGGGPDHWPFAQLLGNAAARVVELETTPGAGYICGLLSRIAELEAEIAQRDSNWARNLAGDLIAAGESEYVPDPRAARMAELEAELEGQQQTAANLVAYTARIAELEAERAGLKFALDCIAAGETRDPAALARVALSDPSSGEDAMKRIPTYNDLLAREARIAELEAANAVCRRDIEALMSSCDKLEAANAELEAERDRLQTESAEYYAMNVASRTERDKLKAALQALYDDCADYIKINHLHRSDGSSATENQVMRQARAALSDPSGETP